MLSYNPIHADPYNIDVLSTSLVTPKSRVLELGCKDGRLTAFLSRQLHCIVTTVELIPKRAKYARLFAKKIIVGNAENAHIQSLIKKNGPYDVIYASAFISFMVNPQAFLIGMKKWLRKNGSVIITFPNIVHLTIRQQILSGKFTYVKSGICDEGHLHFYTRRTAKTLVENAGYTIIHSDMDYYGFPRIEKLFSPIPFSKKMFRTFYSLYPDLFTYQFVFEVKPI